MDIPQDLLPLSLLTYSDGFTVISIVDTNRYSSIHPSIHSIHSFIQHVLSPTIFQTRELGDGDSKTSKT